VEEAGVPVAAGGLPDAFAPDTLVVLDANNWEQLGDLAEACRALACRKICIDHHVAYERFFECEIVDSGACATGLLILDLSRRLGVSLDATTADLLFLAIGSDTGWFRFGNTDARAFEAAAALARGGVAPGDLYERYRGTGTAGALRLMGMAFSDLRFELEGRVAWITVTPGMVERAGLAAMETENFLDHVKYLAGVELAVLFKEVEGGTRISLRSRGGVDVSRLAKRFGGGGHARAAGAFLPCPPDEARVRVFDEARTALGGDG
jgi:phosphoesterase RecJ-like protein